MIKKQYIFVGLILLMSYLLYLIAVYKYEEYVVYKYTQNLVNTNTTLAQNIALAQETLIYKNTKAYKNKVLKAEQGMKNPGETVINLISEDSYQKYTQTGSIGRDNIVRGENVFRQESLIGTMTNTEKWIFLLFNEDIR